MDAIPYTAEQSVLLNYEAHLPLREHYARLTRLQMNTLIDALVAGQPEAIRKLRDEFAVTHVLINDRLLRTGTLSYFAPYQDRLDTLDDHGTGYAFLRSGAMGPIVFEAGDMAIVALSPGS